MTAFPKLDLPVGRLTHDDERENVHAYFKVYPWSPGGQQLLYFSYIQLRPHWNHAGVPGRSARSLHLAHCPPEHSPKTNPLLRTILAFALLVQTATIHAQECHVSAEGLDQSPGLRGTLWRTLAKAKSDLQPGDAVTFLSAEFPE